MSKFKYRDLKITVNIGGVGGDSSVRNRLLVNDEKAKPWNREFQRTPQTFLSRIGRLRS